MAKKYTVINKSQYPRRRAGISFQNGKTTLVLNLSQLKQIKEDSKFVVKGVR